MQLIPDADLPNAKLHDEDPSDADILSADLPSSPPLPVHSEVIQQENVRLDEDSDPINRFQTPQLPFNISEATDDGMENNSESYIVKLLICMTCYATMIW